MFRTFLTLGLLLAAVLPVAAQSDGPATVTPATPPQSESTISPASSAANSKKVWTNENLGGNSPEGPNVSKNKSSPKSSTTPNKPADPATIDRIKKSLQKCQDQLADINLKLENFRKFQEGEDVSSAGTDASKGYTRTPVGQQMATLQQKKKQLELQVDALYEEARKKEIEPGQLR
jgi:hypothetical protein